MGKEAHRSELVMWDLKRQDVSGAVLSPPLVVDRCHVLVITQHDGQLVRLCTCGSTLSYNPYANKPARRYNRTKKL